MITSHVSPLVSHVSLVSFCSCCSSFYFSYYYTNSLLSSLIFIILVMTSSSSPSDMIIAPSRPHTAPTQRSHHAGVRTVTNAPECPTCFRERIVQANFSCMFHVLCCTCDYMPSRESALIVKSPSTFVMVCINVKHVMTNDDPLHAHQNLLLYLHPQPPILLLLPLLPLTYPSSEG